MASSELEARVARLERAVQNGVGIILADHDDQDQQAARAAKAEQDQADAAVAATEAAQQLADEHGVDLSTVEPTGASGQIVKADVAAAVGEGA